MTETNHNPEPYNPALGYNPATESFGPASEKYNPMGYQVPPQPLQPKKRKLGWLPWALLPVAFFLGIGAGAAGGSEEPETEEAASDTEKSPSEPTSQDGGTAGVEEDTPTSEEREMSEEEASFLVLLEMEGSSDTIDIEEDTDELRLLGHKVCGWFDQGSDMEAVIVKLLGESNGIGLDNTGMGEVAGAAVSTLCTEHLEKVTG